MNKRMIFLILAIAIFSILSIHPIDAASNTSKFSKSMALDYLDNKTTGFPDNAMPLTSRIFMC